jgi:hypothetical protein
MVGKIEFLKLSSSPQSNLKTILKLKRKNIGESLPSSTESMVSMSYSVNSRVMS